jgi:hypothetical protein
MALPSSGAISLNNVNVELGLSGTTSINMNQASVRTLFGVASGVISMSNGYGKSNRVTSSATISANTTNYTLNTAKASGYSAGKTDFTLTINSGVYVYSGSTGSYALTVDTSWAAGDTVTIINNGTMLGCGGNGGRGGYGGSTGPGTNAVSGTGAGPALLVQRATSINNVNRIAGGGGGGGGGGGWNDCGWAEGGGGGGGIGNGSGSSLNGTGGSLTSAGTGGTTYAQAGVGGNGGGYGSSGASGTTGQPGCQSANLGAGGGAAGAAVAGNGNITWIATGTRNGGIS